MSPNFAESLPTIVDSVSRADSQENANDECRPPYTWQQLILQALAVAPDKRLDLVGIKTYIETTYSFYKRTGLKFNVSEVYHIVCFQHLKLCVHKAVNYAPLTYAL